MKDYGLVAEIGYALIARDAEGRIQIEPAVKEIRFVKVPEKSAMYNQYILQEEKSIPSIDGFEFVGAANRGESLAGIIDATLQERKLPKDIRIIKPCEKAMRLVFVKQ